MYQTRINMDPDISIKEETFEISTTFLPVSAGTEDTSATLKTEPPWDIKRERSPSLEGSNIVDGDRSTTIDIKHESLDIPMEEETEEAPGFKEEPIDATTVLNSQHVVESRIPIEEVFIPCQANGPSAEEEETEGGMEDQTYVDSEDPLLDTGDVSTESKGKQSYTCTAIVSIKGDLTCRTNNPTGSELFSYEVYDERVSESSPLECRRTNTSKRRFNCELCEKKYRGSRDLKRHFDTVHNRDRPFKCEVCEKRFSQFHHLKEHKMIHSGERPFGCAVCGKTFFRRSDLNVHDRVHTRDKPYRCGFCEKSYGQHSTLVTHRRKHTGEKPFKCAVCAKAFSSRSGLCNHTVTHTADRLFECAVCEKSFTRRGHLAAHRRVHTAVKPFDCSVCGKKFSCKSNLTNHSHLHSEERPFKCDVCDKGYCTRNHLKDHKLRTHGKQTVLLLDIHNDLL